MSSGKYIWYIFIFLLLIAKNPTPAPCTETKMGNITEIEYINLTNNIVNYINYSSSIPVKTGFDIKCENGTQIFCQPMEFDFERLNPLGVYGGQYCNSGSVEDCARVEGCENVLSGSQGSTYYYKVYC